MYTVGYPRDYLLAIQEISNNSTHSVIAQFEHLSYFAYSDIAILRISELVDSTVRTSYIECAYMYEVKLVYDPEPYTLTLKESITYCATVELFLRGIHTSQSSATRILFESERDRMLGLLILSDSTSFTPVCID